MAELSARLLSDSGLPIGTAGELPVANTCALKYMELSLYTFAELTPDPDMGRAISPALRLRNLMEEAALADELGLDVFAIGEHQVAPAVRAEVARQPRSVVSAPV